MPSTRYSFSAHTQRDWDLIEWLDSFHDPRERTLAIKAAVREYMHGEQSAEMAALPDISVVEDLQTQISEMYRVVVELKNNLESREYVAAPASAAKPKTKKVVDMNDPKIREAENNLLTLGD